MPDISPQAVILAAGLGTRLLPLSAHVPKPLFPILNRPLLGIIGEQLREAGFLQVAVNAHHLAGEIEKYVRQECPFDAMHVHFSFEAEILGTGGGLKKLANYLDVPFLVINGDIFTDLDLQSIYQAPQGKGVLATMVLHDYPRFNNVWLNADGDIIGFGGLRPDAAVGSPLAFTGIQVVSPRLLKHIPPGRFVNIIDTYREVIAKGEKIAAYQVQDHYWQDIGTPQDYLEIHQRLLTGQLSSLARFFPSLSNPYWAPGVLVGEQVYCGDAVTIGPGARIGAGSRLRNTVIWAGATVEPGVELTDCIVGEGARVTRSGRGECFI